MGPVHILVVDDEPDLELLIRQKFRRHIRSNDWSFAFAGDGVEALDQLQRNPDIDIVLTDINMPRMDGLTLLTRVGQFDRPIRTVVVSAYGDMQNIRTAMNRGAFDFVTKPIDFDDLETTINKTWAEVEAYRRATEGQRQLIALQRELEVARRIQEAVLVREFPVRSDLELYAFMTPAREVGGDFYDFFSLQDGRLGFAIADVSGKGVSAALFMAVSRTLLEGLALQTDGPAECIRSMNRLLTPRSLPNMFVTVFYGILDPATGTLEYCNAGHNTPFIIHSDGSTELLPNTNSIAVSLMRDFEYGGRTFTLQPGDSILLYTDGVTEAMNEDREEFTIERLQELLGEHPGLSAPALIRAVIRSVTEFTGGVAQSDDITLLALRYQGVGA